MSRSSSGLFKSGDALFTLVPDALERFPVLESLLRASFPEATDMHGASAIADAWSYEGLTSARFADATIQGIGSAVAVGSMRAFCTVAEPAIKWQTAQSSMFEDDKNSGGSAHTSAASKRLTARTLASTMLASSYDTESKSFISARTAVAYMEQLEVWNILRAHHKDTPPVPQYTPLCSTISEE